MDVRIFGLSFISILTLPRTPSENIFQINYREFLEIKAPNYGEPDG